MALGLLHKKRGDVLALDLRHERKDEQPRVLRPDVGGKVCPKMVQAVADRLRVFFICERRGDEGGQMGVYLRDDEGLDVERRLQLRVRYVLKDRPVDKPHTFGREILQVVPCRI